MLQSRTFWSLKTVIEQLEISNEVKNFNLECAVPHGKASDANGIIRQRYCTYCVDRVKPYVYEGKHRGISRVVQSHEVLLLTEVVGQAILAGGLPISLDHDGALICFPGKIDPSEKATEIMEGVGPYSKFLLKREIPLEVKTHYYDGEINPP